MRERGSAGGAGPGGGEAGMASGFGSLILALALVALAATPVRAQGEGAPPSPSVPPVVELPGPEPESLPDEAEELLGATVDAVEDVAIGPPAPPEPPAARAPSRVLYADDFSNPNSGWPRQASDPRTRRVGYGAGEYYVVRLPGSGGSPYVMRLERYGDFQVEIDARLVAPTTDAYVFLEFRRQENGEHYAFVVAPDDGAFTLRRNTAREGTPVIGWTQAPTINEGAAWNRLGVRAVGPEIVLLVNGEEVGRAQDGTLPAGTLAFGVGSLEDGPAEGRFSNLVVTDVD